MVAPTEARNQRHIQNGHHRLVFGLGVLFIGTLVHTVGTVTRSWISNPDQSISYGIFTMDVSSYGAIISVRAFTILGIMLGCVTLMLTGFYLKVTNFLTRRKVVTCIMVTGIGAGGSSLIGALIFALEFYFLITVTDRNYSFALCIVGGVLIIVGSIVIFLGARQHMRGSHFSARLRSEINRSQIDDDDDPSTHQVTYLSPGDSGAHIWHTPPYSEPPPPYNQLELSNMPVPKQQTSQMVFELPPSYTEAVKWYPNT